MNINPINNSKKTGLLTFEAINSTPFSSHAARLGYKWINRHLITVYDFRT